MQRRKFLQTLGLVGIVSFSPVLAQTYPTRSIRLIVPFAPGGPTDNFARLYAEALGKQLGQAVVVENKAGASGTIGSLEVKNSSPDGYALLFGTASTHALYNLIERNTRYDSADDFDYIAVLGGAPIAFAVTPAMPDTLEGFFELAKKNPGRLNYGSPGTGTLLHVATERLLQLTGSSVTHVPYKGSGPALKDLMGGYVELAVGTLGGMLPLHQSGRLKLVGVATSDRLALAPDIATVSESAGLAEPFDAVLWNVVAVRRNTPADIRDTLAKASRHAMEDAFTQTRLSEQGMFVDLRIGNAEASAYVQAEAAKWQPIIELLGDQVRK